MIYIRKIPSYNPFDICPHDIILLIFSWLDHISVIRVTSSCKKFLTLGNQIRRRSWIVLWNRSCPLIIDLSASDDISQYIQENNVKIRRGDIIVKHGDNRRQLLIYDSNEFVKLDTSVCEFGNLPRQFKVIDEFPIGYFSFNINKQPFSNCSIVWFDHRPYLDQILANIQYNERLGSGNNVHSKTNTFRILNGSSAVNEPYLDSYEAKTSMKHIIVSNSLYTYFIHKNGIKYYIIFIDSNFPELSDFRPAMEEFKRRLTCGVEICFSSCAVEFWDVPRTNILILDNYSSLCLRTGNLIITY